MGGSWNRDIKKKIAVPYDQEAVGLVANRLKKINGKVLLDVGANTGSFSLISKFLDCYTYAFEPQSKVCKILESNIKLNKLEKKTTIIKVALSDKKSNSKLKLKIPNSNSGLASIGEVNANDKVKFEEVKVSSIDEVVRDYNIENVDFIKIDVEGFELNVLKGALNTISNYKPELLVEYSKTYQCGYSPLELVRLLKKINYKIEILNSEDFWCFPTNSKHIKFDIHKIIRNVLRHLILYLKHNNVSQYILKLKFF